MGLQQSTPAHHGSTQQHGSSSSGHGHIATYSHHRLPRERASVVGLANRGVEHRRHSRRQLSTTGESSGDRAGYRDGSPAAATYDEEGTAVGEEGDEEERGSINSTSFNRLAEEVQQGLRIAFGNALVTTSSASSSSYPPFSANGAAARESGENASSAFSNHAGGGHQPHASDVTLRALATGRSSRHHHHPASSSSRSGGGGGGSSLLSSHRRGNHRYSQQHHSHSPFFHFLSGAMSSSGDESLPSTSSQQHYAVGTKCPVCQLDLTSLEDGVEPEIHLVMCFTRPRLAYNEEILAADRDAECAICLEEMRNGECIARLPCLCIYHKTCIDAWFKRKNCCPEHPEGTPNALASSFMAVDIFAEETTSTTEHLPHASSLPADSVSDGSSDKVHTGDGGGEAKKVGTKGAEIGGGGAQSE